MIRNALMRLIHQGSGLCPGDLHSTDCSSAACSSATRATPARSCLLDRARSSTRRPVRADADGVAVREPARGRVLGRQLDLRLGPLELELVHALHRRPREERPVTEQAQRASAAAGLGRCGRVGRLAGLRARRQRRLLADLAVGDPAVRARRELLEDLRRGTARARRRSAPPAWRATRARRGRAG